MARTWNPKTGPWLVASRKARGWKQEAVVELLADQQGVSITRSWLSRIENGEPFSDELLGAFVALYQSEPPRADETPVAVGATGIEAVAQILAESVSVMREQLEATRRQNDLLLALLTGQRPMDPATLAGLASLRAFEAEVAPTTSPLPTPDRPAISDR